MKKIYLIQPTYRTMDGELIKEFPLFNYSYNLPILSAVIPANWEKEICMEYCQEINYDSDATLIMITSVGYDIAHARKIAEKFKSRNKPVVFGANMDDLSDKLLSEVCDAVFFGYPDKNKMSQLLSDVENNTISKQYSFGINIDYPFDYSVFDQMKLWAIPIVASMGCKNTCSYCCYTPVFDGKYRMRHLDNIVADLKSTKKFRRPRVFLDANLYNNRKFLKSLCTRIIDEKLDINWGGQCTIDVGDDPEILHLLNKSGCRLLFFGLETLNQKNMVQLNKPYDVTKYKSQIKNIRRAGIQVGAFFMLGMDEDTNETFEEVSKFIKKSHIDLPYVHMLLPVPGTPLYHEIRNRGSLINNYYDNFLEDNPGYSVPCSNAYYQPKQLSVEELEKGYIGLAKKISSVPSIIGRLIRPPYKQFPIIFFLNLQARREYRAMLMTRLERQE